MLEVDVGLISLPQPRCHPPLSPLSSPGHAQVSLTGRPPSCPTPRSTVRPLCLWCRCSALALGFCCLTWPKSGHKSLCACRRGSPARCHQSPVFPGQRGGRVRIGGRLHLHELQIAGHDRCGGHGSTSGGEWVDYFEYFWIITGQGKWNNKSISFPSILLN